MKSIPDEMGETERRKLLQRHASAFAMSETDLGRTAIVKQRIETETRYLYGNRLEDNPLRTLMPYRSTFRVC